MSSLKLQTPTVSNVNSDCLYSELLRFPSIIGPWEDRILPQPAGERHTQRGKREQNEKRNERQQRRRCTKKLKSLPSGERLSGAFPRFLSDEPLEDKSEALSPRRLAEGEILSARWSESTRYDRQTDGQTPALAGITVKTRQEQGGTALFSGADGRT